MKLEYYFKIEPILDTVRSLEQMGALNKNQVNSIYERIDDSNFINLIDLNWTLKITDINNDRFDLTTDKAEDLYMIVLCIQRWSGSSSIPLFHKEWE